LISNQRIKITKQISKIDDKSMFKQNRKTFDSRHYSDNYQMKYNKILVSFLSKVKNFDLTTLYHLDNNIQKRSTNQNIETNLDIQEYRKPNNQIHEKNVIAEANEEDEDCCSSVASQSIVDLKKISGENMLPSNFLKLNLSN